MIKDRVFSGMRPTGFVHLGHYNGILKNWVKLQDDYSCFFCISDLHALTTNYISPQIIKQSILDLLIDWLAVGIDPNKSTIFVQSHISEHIELALLLGMVTPINWINHIPTYKEQIKKNYKKNLLTYGFLGYPVLMAADILLYKASIIPVGEDQIPHIEIARKISRKFNSIYSKNINISKKRSMINSNLNEAQVKFCNALYDIYDSNNFSITPEQSYNLINQENFISINEGKKLFNYLSKNLVNIFPEPSSILTNSPKIPGINGEKMSKSYNNTINLRDNSYIIEKKVLKMKTDPSRINIKDKGNPSICPVWKFHKIYTDLEYNKFIEISCRLGKIGCIDCKKIVIKNIVNQQEPITEKAQKYINDPLLLKSIILDGRDKAKKFASETMKEVREVIGI